MNICNCEVPSDVFNGVCGACLLPLVDAARNNAGTLVDDDTQPLFEEEFESEEFDDDLEFED